MEKLFSSPPAFCWEVVSTTRKLLAAFENWELTQITTLFSTDLKDEWSYCTKNSIRWGFQREFFIFEPKLTETKQKDNREPAIYWILERTNCGEVFDSLSGCVYSVAATGSKIFKRPQRNADELDPTFPGYDPPAPFPLTWFGTALVRNRIWNFLEFSTTSAELMLFVWRAGLWKSKKVGDENGTLWIKFSPMWISIIMGVVPTQSAETKPLYYYAPYFFEPSCRNLEHRAKK